MKHIGAVLPFLSDGLLAHAQETLSGLRVRTRPAALRSDAVQFFAICLRADGNMDSCSGKTDRWICSQPTLAIVNSGGLVRYGSNCGAATHHTPTESMRWDV